MIIRIVLSFPIFDTAQSLIGRLKTINGNVFACSRSAVSIPYR